MNTRSQNIEVGGEGTNDITDSDNDSGGEQNSPEWTPGTRYLQQKLSNVSAGSSNSTRETPYALRSKKVRDLSGRAEEERPIELPPHTVAGQKRINREEPEIEREPVPIKTPNKHSYNLRSPDTTE
jgi:hypothetical protein